jgi:hypothetical protein
MECCDTLFIFTPRKSNQRTVFTNPYLRSFYLNIDNYGVYPPVPYATYNDERFLSLVADSLYVDTSQLTSFNKDISSSFVSESYAFPITTATKLHKNEETANVLRINEDDANFLIGLPFSPDGDFQGGLHTNGTASTFQLIGQVVGAGKLFADDTQYEEIHATWVAGFLQDGLIGIIPNPEGGLPLVSFTTKAFPQHSYV